MKRLLFMLLMANIGICFGQNRTTFDDQLLHAKTDSERLNIYTNVLKHLRFQNADSVSLYLKKGYADFAASGYRRGQGSILLMEGEIYADNGMLPNAENTILQSLAIFRKANDTRYIAKALKTLGIVEGKRGKYALATQHFIETLKIYESLKDNPGIADAYIKLGVVNELNHNLEKGLYYYQLALSLCKSTDSFKKANIYNNIGTAYCRQMQYSKAIPYFLTAAEYADNQQYTDIKITLYNNLGEAYNNLHDAKSALIYYDRGLELAQRPIFKEDRIRLSLNKAALTADTKPELALQQLCALLLEADSLQLASLKEDIINTIVIINKMTGHYKEAVIYQARLQSLKDSLYSIAKATEIANLQSVYDLEKSQEKIVLLQSQKKEREQKSAIMIVIAVLLATALLFLTYAYKNKRRLNKNLVVHEAELERLNDIKTKMFSIIGHDLRGYIGPMPMLTMLLDDESTDEAEKAYIIHALQTNATASLDTLDTLLTWGKAQIKGITIEPTDFAVKELIQSLVTQQEVAINKKQIKITTSADEQIKIWADKNHFLFVMRNLISNAIKFSNENGTIAIRAENTLNEVTFSVQDYGVGMSKENKANIFNTGNTSARGTANETGSSIALVLCSEFVAKNGGKIWVESTQGNGSIFYFTLPRSKVVSSYIQPPVLTGTSV